MNTLLEKIKQFAQLKKIWLVVAILIFGAIYLNVASDKSVSYISEQAKIQDISQLVSVTASVESKDRVDLRFEQGGAIKYIPVKVGDFVKAGDVLARLNDDQLRARVYQASAGVEIAKAELNLLMAGPTKERIEISKIKMEEALINEKNAKTKLEDSKSRQIQIIKKSELNLANAESLLAKAESDYDNAVKSNDNTESQSTTTLDSTYSDAEDAVLKSFGVVREALEDSDLLFGLNGDTYSDNIEELIKDSDLYDQVSAKNSIKVAGDYLQSTELKYNNLQTTWSQNEADLLIADAQDMLFNAKNAIDKSYKMLSDIETGSESLKIEIDSVMALISANQASLNSAISALSTAKQAVENAKLNTNSSDISSNSNIVQAESNLTQAKNNLEIAKSDLASLKLNHKIELNELEANLSVLQVRYKAAQADHADLIAEPRYVELASAKARIAQANAQLEEQNAQLKDAMLVSPISGKISDITFKVGETANTSEVAFVVLTDQLQIKANVSEVDIAKLHSGDKAEFTLDAFSVDKKWTATLATINPAETIIQGVVYYEVVLVIDSKDEEVRSGMTANVEILTESRKGVVSVPVQSIQNEDGENFVYIIKGNEKLMTPVAIGLEGEEYIEILEGVKEGDEVLLYEEN